MIVDPIRFGSEERFKVDVEGPAYKEGWADELVLFHKRCTRSIHLSYRDRQVRIADGHYAETGPMRVLWSQATTHDFLARRDGHPPWDKYPFEGEAS